MSNDVNIILCTFTALVEISFFSWIWLEPWDDQLFQTAAAIASDDHQSMKHCLISGRITLILNSAIGYLISVKSENTPSITIIIYHVLCSMQVLRTQKKLHHQKISKGLLSTTSTQMVITNFQTQQWPLSCKQLDLQVSPIWEPTCQRPRSCCYKMIQVTHKNSPPIPPMGLSAEWMEWMEWMEGFSFPISSKLSNDFLQAPDWTFRWSPLIGEFPPPPLAMSAPRCVELHKPSAPLDVVIKVELGEFHNVFLQDAARCCKLLQGMGMTGWPKPVTWLRWSLPTAPSIWISRISPYELSKSLKSWQ